VFGFIPFSSQERGLPRAQPRGGEAGVRPSFPSPLVGEGGRGRGIKGEGGSWGGTPAVGGRHSACQTRPRGLRLFASPALNPSTSLGCARDESLGTGCRADSYKVGSSQRPLRAAPRHDRFGFSPGLQPRARKPTSPPSPLRPAERGDGGVRPPFPLPVRERVPCEALAEQGG